ncbi:MAG: transglycosylase SLT domain-containing protein [Woeseiaceae bacterium]|nr:transglycosylase SLT domain-containing protein [Woeseiaceae bacterium]
MYDHSVRWSPETLRRLWLTAALCAAFCCPAAASSPDLLAEQRSLFEAVYVPAERGDWSAFEQLSPREQLLLRSYVLWPDLRAAWLRARIRDAEPREVERFLDAHGLLKPARELRYRYALELARRGDLAGYHAIYVSFYQGLDIARLDCLALQAELARGRAARVVRRARDLWLVGRSQAEECDQVFEWMKQQNLLSMTDYLERFELAIEAREFSLARWLGRSISEAHVESARLWMSAQSNPENFLRTHARRSNDDSARDRLAYAARRLTYRDPSLARSLWAAVVKRYPFSEQQRLEVARHIALWTARDNLPQAYRLLTALPAAAQNEEVLRWRARSSLRDHRWQDLLTDIAAMPPSLGDTEEWRYWRAVALRESGQINAAIAGFEALADERSYYGFLAADAIGAEYAFAHAELSADAQAVDALAARTEFRRARELFLVGLDGRGRSEWEAATAYLSAEQKRHAAILADRWGWHSRAIATAASVGEYDDLSLRYPLAFRNTFEQHAGAANISPTWAYGIARSESLFMRDVRSSAGAIGLMQLMPTTGRAVARSRNLPYTGIDTLTDPDANIRLGTLYLAQMADRFGGSQVLATAAYNAGPHRVDAWMPARGSIDARIWIETIPFDETRTYVRRVMAADTIFQWRLTNATARLSDSLGTVHAPRDAQRVASASR